MKYFSMFSGIGGFEYGIQNADRKLWQEERISTNNNQSDSVSDILQGHSAQPGRTSCVGYSEIDKYAIKVYERNFNESCDEHAHISQESKQEERTQGRKRSTDKQGLQLHDRNRSATLCNKCKGHTNYGNATTINAAELPDFDLLVGGFPCQAFSIAGKRAGFDDTRGTLFFDIARILKEKQPRHLVLENVKGLLSHDGGRTFTTIIGVLADLGYFVEWQVLNSKDFGVPQNRERVIIVGHLRGECRRKVFPISGTNGKDTRIIGQDVAYAIDANYHKGTNTLEKSRRSVVALTETRTEESKRIRRESQKQGRDFSPRRGKVLKPRADNIGNTVTAGQSKEHYLASGTRIRRLTPKERERLQGFPDNWTALDQDGQPISDTQRYKMCGNAVTTNVIQAVMEGLINHEL